MGRGYRNLGNNISLDTIVKRNQHIDTTDINGDKAMMNLEKGMYYALNDIGSRIWDLIGETTKVRDIIDNLLEEYDIEDVQCILEVKDYLDVLSKEELIVLA